MFQRATVEPLREILKVDDVDFGQMQGAGEGFAKGIMRVERCCEEWRACEKSFEVEGKRVGVGTDGEGYGRFEEMSGLRVSIGDGEGCFGCP